jgi:Fe-S-cluster containining protein
MTAKDWVEATGVAMPQCKMQGCCCRGASPSIPYHQLLEKAANGDEFARNFFTLFVPHGSHEDAKKIVPGLVERTLTASRKDKNFQSDEDIVFYQCRYIGDDNRCQIWEDRPDLCRAYPDSPFLVFAPNCAFEPWAKTVKEKYKEMKESIETLKEQKKNLLEKGQANSLAFDAPLWLNDNLPEALSSIMVLTPSYLVSPIVTLLS